MSYRDDHEALLLRVEALERELAQSREAHTEALAKLAARDAEPAPEAPVPSAPPLALVTVEREKPKTRSGPLLAAIATVAGWTTFAAVFGASAWMLPVTMVTALLPALFMDRDEVRVVVGELEKRWPTLPIDQDTYRDLLALPRRTVVVRMAVAFEKQPSRGDREKIKQRVRELGAVSWDQATMTIASGTLRTGKGKGDAWAFDPEVIRVYCARAFDVLVDVHAEHSIEHVWPRARSR